MTVNVTIAHNQPGAKKGVRVQVLHWVDTEDKRQQKTREVHVLKPEESCEVELSDGVMIQVREQNAMPAKEAPAKTVKG